MLFAILQKYDFSSKSQLNLSSTQALRGCLRYCKSTIFQANHNPLSEIPRTSMLFAILQKYDFSSKSQPLRGFLKLVRCCLRYCKSTIFQANHNRSTNAHWRAKLFAILQKYDFSSKSQQRVMRITCLLVVCDTAKVRFFKQITTKPKFYLSKFQLFAILQKYDFSSKSQLIVAYRHRTISCLRYCKSTIFQANHNKKCSATSKRAVVCDTAKVRFFKQITTLFMVKSLTNGLFAILQKYDFSSKSQPLPCVLAKPMRCLRYCKSTIFQANHNPAQVPRQSYQLFAILQKYDFSSKSQLKVLDMIEI